MADAAPPHAPSNAHADLMARDAARVYGWRYQPAIQFERGEGIWLYDVDGKPYYDLTAGMMCNVLGHCHPELVEVMRAEAGRLWHENSWYSNPHLVRFAERIASTLPEGLEVVNFAVTGSEANEVAMRMALAVSGKHDILSVIRGLHGGSLAVESVTTIGGARRRHLGPLLAPANAPAIYAPFCYRCPINLEYPTCDVACLAQSRELIDHITSGDIAAVLAETMLVAGGMVVPPPEWLPRLKQLEIVLRDRLDERAAATGQVLRTALERLRDAHAVIGDVRGQGLYQMLDIVREKETRTPDPAMAERIRLNAALGGVIVICVKNFLRICPPLTVTEEEIAAFTERLDRAIRLALDGHPKDVDFRASSSLAMGGGASV